MPVREANGFRLWPMVMVGAKRMEVISDGSESISKEVLCIICTFVRMVTPSLLEIVVRSGMDFRVAMITSSSALIVTMGFSMDVALRTE